MATATVSPATATASPAKWSGRKPHFIVNFMPNLSSERLEIPHRFNQHIDGKSNVWVLLSGSSGKVWRVGLVKQEETLFFNEGWSGFVRDNSLDFGDTLAFEYSGDWQFEVYIFDDSGCEKEVRECRVEFGKKRGRDEDDVRLGNVSGCASNKRASNVCESSMDCVNKEHNDLLAKPCQQGAYIVQPLAMIVCDEPTPSNQLNFSRNQSCDPALTSLCNFQRATQKYKDIEQQTLQGTGSKLKFSASEEKISQTFKSHFPHFVRVMKNFNVSGSFTLKIPYKFSMAHLPQCKTKVVLETSAGSCWTVNSIPTTNVNTCHTFCGGWLAFVRANDIEAGDACVFELVSECKMLVHILREERRVSEFHGEKKSKFRSLSSVSNDIKRHGLGSKNSSRYGYCLPRKMVDLKSERTGGDNVDAQSRISTSAEEEKIANSFPSRFPYFVRIMKKFNVSGSFTIKIPHQFSTSHLPGCKTELVLRNAKGEPWTVNSVPAANRPTMHTICGGWMAFVRGNNIRLGDILIFELVSEGQLNVHISRPGTTSTPTSTN
ncbi:unnamed protein product [Rhodiola kirilowii]